MAKVQFDIKGYSTNVSNEAARAIDAALAVFKAACVHEYLDFRAPASVIIALDPDPAPVPVAEPAPVVSAAAPSLSQQEPRPRRR